MTTPPLDLSAERLATLRDIANAATPGPWESRGYEVETVPEFDLHRFDVMSETVASCDLLKSDATHIAAFDPPTVLALLNRVEAAERDLAAVTVSRDGWQTRAEAAEKAVARVRELHKSVPVYTTEAGDCEHDGDCEAVEISAGSYCPVHTDGLTCNECAELAEHADDLPAYPCPTITALDTHTPETETTP